MAVAVEDEDRVILDPVDEQAETLLVLAQRLLVLAALHQLAAQRAVRQRELLRPLVDPLRELLLALAGAPRLARSRSRITVFSTSPVIESVHAYVSRYRSETLVDCRAEQTAACAARGQMAIVHRASLWPWSLRAVRSGSPPR